MKRAAATIRCVLASGFLIFCADIHLTAQDSPGQSPSLGDVARQSRTEHASPGHSTARHSLSTDDDGPDSTGIWRVQLCPQMPCAVLSIALPKTPRWIRAADEPRPVLIPAPDKESDLARAIRVYAAESLEPRYSLDVAKRNFLQARFAQPEYFGHAARLERDERVKVDNYAATITHFSIESSAARYHGLSVLCATAYGNFGFACVFREEDAGTAGAVCDAIIKSARFQTIWPRRLTIYPGPGDASADPPDDPPNDDDPE